jgi:hypothetical protein
MSPFYAEFRNLLYPEILPGARGGLSESEIVEDKENICIFFMETVKIILMDISGP